MIFCQTDMTGDYFREIAIRGTIFREVYNQKERLVINYHTKPRKNSDTNAQVTRKIISLKYLDLIWTKLYRKHVIVFLQIMLLQIQISIALDTDDLLHHTIAWFSGK